MKKILITQAGIAPYKVDLFNRLSEYFDITVLYYQKSEKYRNWDDEFQKIKYKYFICENQTYKIFNKKINIIRFPNNFNIKEFDEVIYCTDLANIIGEFKIKKIAKKNNIKTGVWITLYDKYNLFTNSKNIFEKLANYVTDKIIKYLMKDADKFLGYSKYSCKMTNEKCIQSSQYYNLYEEYGQINLDYIKKINNNRFNNKRLKILIISYLTQRKEIEFAIEIINKFQDKLELHIVGDGDGMYKSYLENISKKNIFFHNAVYGKSKKNLLEKYDLMWFHSKKDVWGFVVNEAMYLGLPLIASKNVIGARQIITDTGLGLLYETKDEAINILKDIINKKYDLKKISESSHIHMSKFNKNCFLNVKNFLES